MDAGRFINSLTPDVRMRRILKQAAQVDDSPSARCVMKAFLGSQITALIKARAPRLGPAAQVFIRAPEPANIYRGLQLYVWLNEKIPEGHDRETLILLGMQMYLEKEAKASVARQAVDLMAVR
jgi:hypothetical protein